jgi:glycosyltransferase involved in cell wall biosynthesis
VVTVGTVPIRVVHLFRRLPVGGAERVALDLLSRLDRDRFEPSVCSTGREGGALAPAFEAAGIPVHHVRVPSRLGPVGLARLALHLRRERAQLLHAHMYPSNVTGTVAGRLARVPAVVGHVHNVGEWHGAAGRLLDRRLVRARDCTLVCSRDALADYLAGVGRGRGDVRLFENAVDLAAHARGDEPREEVLRSLGVPPGDAVLGMVAAFRPQKDHALLLRAFRRVVAARHATTLVLPGDGETRDAAETLASELGIGDRVRFPGSRDDVPRILRALDLFVLASHHEGLPLAVIEALAAGVPVVATAVGGVPSLLEDGRAGLLVPRGDEDALAGALLRLLGEPELGRSLAREGARVVRGYGIEGRAAELQELYLELLRRKGVAA